MGQAPRGALAVVLQAVTLLVQARLTADGVRDQNGDGHANTIRDIYLVFHGRTVRLGMSRAKELPWNSDPNERRPHRLAGTTRPFDHEALLTLVRKVCAAAYDADPFTHLHSRHPEITSLSEPASPSPEIQVGWSGPARISCT